MTAMLARHAEAAFWLARYIERAESLARLIEVHASFQRGRVDDASYAWMLALYSDEARFAKSYAEATAENVIRFYVNDLENAGSIQSCVRAARENARALRPLISLDMWFQLNDFYTRVLALGADDFREMRLSRTCDAIKRGCYAQYGVAETTLYRDEIWPFYMIGMYIERADQMSRLLDVRFAQRRLGLTEKSAEIEGALWSILLRSASAYHAFRRVHKRGQEPVAVARFLLFDTRMPRSIAFCLEEMTRMVEELCTEFRLREATGVVAAIAETREGLEQARQDEALLDQLHDLNDWTQRRLIVLTTSIGRAFFGHEAVAA